jgi:hypothetical protein
MASRLSDLEELREGLIARMAGAESDQNYAVLGRLLTDVLKQIDELGGGEQEEPKETGLSDFERRLRERQSGAAGSRSAAG